MSLFIIAVLGAVLLLIVFALFIHIRRRSSTVSSDSSDDETSGPLSVNVVADHDEQDSLLPKFAGLLRSPWHSVESGQKEQPKVMRPVRKGGRSMSLTMPLPLRKKRKSTEVPIKKIHVPYFFPLLDETAEWWQAQHSTVANSQPTPEQEPEAGLTANSPSTCSNQCKREIHISEVSGKEQRDVSLHFAAATISSTPIEVGGK